MHLRCPVRAIEAWLIADRAGVARYLAVGEKSVPAEPELLENPKQILVNLARKSRRRAIRDDLVPALGHTVRVGPAYSARVSDFAANHWDPSDAARSSDSLRRCMRVLRSLSG
jgi:hypothetical protein